MTKNVTEQVTKDTPQKNLRQMLLSLLTAKGEGTAPSAAIVAQINACDDVPRLEKAICSVLSLKSPAEFQL